MATALYAAAPSAPLGVAMVSNSPDSITVAWYRPAAGEVVASYNVYASEKKDGEYARVATVTDRSAVHAKLPAATTRFYKVTAANADGESPMSTPAEGFTFVPCAPTPFPVRIANNMCVTLGTTIVSKQKPIAGKLENLVDGSDATGCRLRKDADVRLRINHDAAIADAEYLILHFRTDCTPADFSNDRNARTLRHYVITESKDSTNGEDGTWQEIASSDNDQLDGVIVIPNNRPTWIGVRSAYGKSDEVPAANDRRPAPRDLMLCRLDVFRSAPSGQRNDYWIFTGDSLVAQDMTGGGEAGRKAWFSDLVRQQFPDRYPMVVHAARGGEMLKDTYPRTQKLLPVLSPENPSKRPTGTIVCWESGFNDVGVGGSLWQGRKLMQSYQAAKDLCEGAGLIMVPVRLEYATTYLNPDTLEPSKYNVFYNTLAVNLGGIDEFCRTQAPYACDPQTQLPYADYWSYTRQNHATALGKDGVHHTKEGCDGINRLWADVAARMVYRK